MPIYYQQTDIDPGHVTEMFGHAVHTRAKYTPYGTRIIYKENKHAKPELSILEVAFSELAHLFLEPNLTPRQVIVKNEQNEVVGSASEHISYTIARNENDNQSYYQYIDATAELTTCSIGDAKDIPYYFFNKPPPGFFKKLADDAESGKISLDMKSLASVLTSSYTLEEDDLHKGNFGFYVVEKDSKPLVIFFKIDHDMMLSDSVMSHLHTRYFNWLHGKGAFEITEGDLMHFPYLTDSENYYWPTSKRFFHSVGNKAYTDEGELKAFANLAKSPEFCQCKWQAFYKHILIPPMLIQHSLMKHLDRNNPDDCARIALITQSVVTRQARLRAVLFSIPAFRDAVVTMDKDADQRMLQSILQGVDPADAPSLKHEIEESMAFHKVLSKPGQGIIEGDTPLHVAIRLKDYRYLETWESFGRYAGIENSQGEKPLDVAVKRLETQEKPSDDIRDNPCCIMKHMLQQGAKKTQAYLALAKARAGNLNDDTFHAEYSEGAARANSIPDLKKVLCRLGEDYRFNLKMQKDIAVIAVQRFIDAHKEDARLGKMMSELKVALNGHRTLPPAPELQFIRRLRSQLWIVRIFRGLLGGTATQVHLNSIIDKEIRRTSPSAVTCCSFFSNKQPQQAKLLHIPPMADNKRLTS